MVEDIKIYELLNKLKRLESEAEKDKKIKDSDKYIQIINYQKGLSVAIEEVMKIINEIESN